MATSSSTSHALIQARTGDTLMRVAPRPALRGFGNLLHNETRAWWRTRKWLVHLVLWIAIINGFAGLIAWAEGRDGQTAAAVYGTAIQVFFILGGMAAALGIVTTTQGAIVSEKQLGTAAWLMSKPASRSAFVLAKLLAHAGAFLVLTVAIPAVVFCMEGLLAGRGMPPLLPFATGLALAALHLLFYLALTLMLGTLFSARGPIAGIGIGFLFAGQLAPNLLPQLGTIFPWQLPQAAAGLVLEQPLPAQAFLTMSATAMWIICFITAALWRFGREEF